MHDHIHFHRTRHTLHAHAHEDGHQHNYVKGIWPDDFDWHPERRERCTIAQLLELSVKRIERAKR